MFEAARVELCRLVVGLLQELVEVYLSVSQVEHTHQQRLRGEGEGVSYM